MPTVEVLSLRSKFLVVSVTAFTIAFATPGAAMASDSSYLFDDFEAARLDHDRWWTGQLIPGKYWIDRKTSRSGATSLAIKATPDFRGCGDQCQRNEIRTSPQMRVRFGQDLWYGFSFRISGDLPEKGNERWLSGQWKQQSGGSPFLSQRFDRGIFHIVVHDGSCRILVAKAKGRLEPLSTTIDVRKVSKFAYKDDKWRYRCDTKLVVESGSNAVLPNPYKNWVDVVYRVRGQRDHGELIEIWADRKFIARVRGPIGYDDAAGPYQYFKFGIYRDAMPGTAIVHFDNFRRSMRPPNDLQIADER